MSRQRSRDRQARFRQFYETLPPVQGGVVISIMLGYALAVVMVDGVLAFAVIRGACRGWGQRRFGPVTAVRAGISPALVGALAAVAVQRATAEWLLRAVDAGRAQVWLERHDRWLAGGAGDQDRHR